MASLNDALPAIDRHVEFPRSRSVGVARRLHDAGNCRPGILQASYEPIATF